MDFAGGTYQLLDLSRPLTPGQEERRLEVRRRKLAVDDTFMYEIDTMSHVGTHVEGPSHFYESGAKTMAELSVEAFLGRGVLLDLSRTRPRVGLTAADLERAANQPEPGDIALLWSGCRGDDAPHLTAQSATWLRNRRIKLLGLDDTVRLGSDVPEIREVHDILMSQDITFLENLCRLEELRGKEFWLIALPLLIAELDSSPVRAVALVKI